VKTLLLLGCVATGAWVGTITPSIGAAYVHVQQTEMTPVEKYGVLGLVYAVVLGVGAGMIRAMLRMGDKIELNTQASLKNVTATEKLADRIGQFCEQTQRSHDIYAAEREKAVSTITTTIKDMREDMLREMDRRLKPAD